MQAIVQLIRGGLRLGACKTDAESDPFAAEIECQLELVFLGTVPRRNWHGSDTPDRSAVIVTRPAKRPD